MPLNSPEPPTTLKPHSTSGTNMASAIIGIHDMSYCTHTWSCSNITISWPRCYISHSLHPNKKHPKALRTSTFHQPPHPANLQGFLHLREVTGHRRPCHADLRRGGLDGLGLTHEGRSIHGLMLGWLGWGSWLLGWSRCYSNSLFGGCLLWERKVWGDFLLTKSESDFFWCFEGKSGEGWYVLGPFLNQVAMGFHPLLPTPLMRSDTKPQQEGSWLEVSKKLWFPPNPWTPNKISIFQRPKSRNISIYNLEISSSKKNTHKTVEPVALLEPCTSRFQKFSDPKSLGFGSASASIGPSFRGFGMPEKKRKGR